jgi:hypothetical protein
MHITTGMAIAWLIAFAAVFYLSLSKDRLNLRSFTGGQWLTLAILLVFHCAVIKLLNFISQ